MFPSRESRIAMAMTGALLALCPLEAAMAAPMSLAGAAIVAPRTAIADARHRGSARRHYRRGSRVGPSAIIGLFGAALGAAALANRYDNYSNYSYGGMNDYGYSPGYGGGGGFGGGGRGGFGGGRGGFGGHGGGRGSHG